MVLTILIGVFGLFHPQTAEVKPANGGVLIVETGAERIVLEGRLRARFTVSQVAGQPVRVSARDGGPADLLLSIPGRIERRFHGSLQITARDGELILVIAMDRETAVASAVAAESPPGAPIEALKAQAVVTRSYYAAARGRHAGFDFCDTTHCQFLRSPPGPTEPVRAATIQTRGLILFYRGATLPALYSANCGGRTLALPESADGEYPYFEVDCPRHGPVAGHGLGLCQQGAASMAAAGADFRRILDHYFPNTRITD